MCEETCLIDDWSALPGQDVEIRRGAHAVRTGRVEAAMADGSALWLAQDGPLERKMIAKIDGYTVRATRCSCPSPKDFPAAAHLAAAPVWM